MSLVTTTFWRSWWNWFFKIWVSNQSISFRWKLRVRFFVDCQLKGGLNWCFFVNAVEVNRVFSSTAASVELPVGSTAGPSSTRLGEAGWTSTEGKPRPQTRSTVSSTATRFIVNGAFLLNFLVQLAVHEKTHPRKYCFFTCIRKESFNDNVKWNWAERLRSSTSATLLLQYV